MGKYSHIIEILILFYCNIVNIKVTAIPHVTLWSFERLICVHKLTYLFCFLIFQLRVGSILYHLT